MTTRSPIYSAIAAAGLALGLLMAGSPAVAQTGKISVAQSVDVLTLDPTQNTAAFSINAYQNIFGHLNPSSMRTALCRRTLPSLGR